MAQSPDPIAPLREALAATPDNVPLRRLLADTLLSLEEYEAAEIEYTEILKRDADSVDAKVGLARASFHQGKHSVGIVVLEDLVARDVAAPEAMVLYAWLLTRSGRMKEAVTVYQSAIARDPDAGDDELADRLGVGSSAETSEVVDGRIRNAVDSIFDDEGDAPERPKISFADVGGMDDLKDEIRMKIVLPMTNKDLYAQYGKKAGGGILMYGPPGCGKTYLARATAGEIKAGFISVGLHDVLDMWIGQSEKKLHEIFGNARRNNPCVLFFDEVDALGASRNDMRRSAGRHTINQFLSELDGVEHSNEGVLVLAATNAPWHLDSAFRRPGRFDRIIFVPPPDGPAHAGILELLLKGKPVDSVDFAAVAKKTKDFSGADLEAMVDRAVEKKLTEAMKSGQASPLTTKDLVAAAKLQAPTTKEWFAAAKNYALFSNEAGLYDDVLRYLGISK